MGMFIYGSVNCSLQLIFVSCLVVSLRAVREKRIEVFEGILPATTLLTLPRKQGFEYLLEDSSRYGSSLFHITPEGVLTTKAILDHEDKRGNIFDLVIVCRELGRTEGGIPTVVHVVVLDRNDNAPKFPKDLYTASVTENSPAGTYVQGLEDVFAQDLDSGLNSVYSYSISAGNEAGLFAVEVNELTGVKFLRLRTKAPIDRERTAFFVLTVKVTDGGKKPLSSTTQIRVNVLDTNDCVPLFDPQIYSITVNENTNIGTSVLQVKAVDKDVGTNADVYYYFSNDHDFFAINPHTGVVSVVSHLDFKKGNYFKLTVVAVDRGKNPHNSSTLVNIRLLEVDGYPPREIKPGDSPIFELSTYVKIREDLPVRAAFLHIRVRSDLEGSRTRVNYELSPISLRGIFHINAKSGIITLLKPLDFETKNSYSLKIKAQDIWNPKFFAETQVAIEIADVDENYSPPVFNTSTVLVSIPPSVSQNIIVAKISAVDHDGGKNADLKYSIIGGSGVGRFSINDVSGVIRPFGKLDQEQGGGRYDLYIEARDGEKFPRTARLYLLILAGIKNEKRPFFFAPTQTAEVREDSIPDTFVTVIRAEFKGFVSRRDSNPIRYSISGGNDNGKFSISSDTGVISTTTSLDRERQSRYTLEVQAKVEGAPQGMGSPAQVVVMVTDVNDNSPVFMKKMHKVHIRENQGPIPNLLCLVASDKDTGANSNLTYSIESGNDDGLFSIHPTLGILALRGSLDFEKVSSHHLTVRAMDHGTPNRSSLTKVKVMVQDGNDPPVFLQHTYEVIVPDSTKIGTIIAVLDITDEDSDYSNGGNKPVSIEEDAQPGRTLTIINTTDEDTGKNGQIVCTIDDVDADEMDMFTFHTVRQGCALVLLNYLEYSQRTQYYFKVRATDQANAVQTLSTTANVIVRVRDGNNHVPTFLQSSYWIPLPENAAIGTTVLRISTSDLDSGSNAATKYQSSSDIFTIHPTDGTLTLQQRATANKKYTFAVTAFDQGTPSKSSVAKVFVSVHSISDSPPRFRKSEYEKKVPENMSLKTNILRVEARKSGVTGELLKYYLVGGDPHQRFKIDSSTGWLSLKQSLDFEKKQSYRLVVRAVQQGWLSSMPELPAETTITINVKDINDNAPRFAIPREPLVTSIDQFRNAGTVVTKVTAYDRDSGSHASITYGIENPGSVPFFIEPATGIIRSSSILKHAQRDFYAFELTATDSTAPFHKATAHINVHVNNVSPPPAFTKGDYATIVSENTDVGTSLLRIRADYKGSNTLKYGITSGNHDNAFCIDVKGDVTVRRRLDREKVETYSLRIIVGEKNLTSAGPEVIINLGDINDNAPLFSQPVYKVSTPENLRGGYVIGRYSAHDPDKDANSRITYSIINFENSKSDRLFVINSMTGVLKTTSTLDRELLNQHILTIRARDTGSPSLSGLAQIVVIVKDVNDHAPRFSSGSFNVRIPLTTRADSKVFQAKALDPDRGRNGVVRYSIIGGNRGNYFSINPIDGSLFLDEKLATLQPIDIKIRALDMGSPGRNSTADVKVVVYALDGPPQFLSSPFVGNITENERAGTFLVQVRAASVDPVMYSIVSGNEAGNFNLHPGIGWMTTVRPLDHEKKARYVLDVMASDLTNRISKVKVVINVINVNDNEPKFMNIRNGEIEGNVLVDVAIGSRVMQITAVDADSSDRLSYQINDEKAARYFRVDKNGVLRSRKALGDLKTPFLFTVGVSDNGKPPKRATARARLVLLKYQLIQGQQRASVAESLAVGTRVLTLLTAKPIRNARYSIVSPSESSFKVDPSSGAVMIKTALDFETKRMHRFTAQAQNTRDEKDYTNIDVIIEVIDSNDNKPEFVMNKTKGLYIARTSINPTADTKVFQLIAIDKDSGLNGIVQYRMVTNPSGFFTVDPTTGAITTRGRIVLLSPWFNLTVEAYDLGKPSLATTAVVNVKTGQFPPLFERKEYIFIMDENTQKGFTVGTVQARSFSGALLRYEIVQGSGHKKFVLDSNTGRLTLPDPLDYERDSNVFFIKVSAKETDVTFNRLLKSETRIKLLLRDLNDNPPEFTQQSYRDTLPESAPVGTTVLSVTARDRDSGINGQFRYSARSSFFSVDPYTGWITTKKSLDYEIAVSHTFLVVAQDSGQPVRNGTARVTVVLTNVNDNPPRFSQSLYNVFVAEDAGSDHLVATVQATDKDHDSVRYSIASGNNTTNFVINSETGVIKLVKKRKPELIGPYYTMNISATDGLHVSQAMVVVAIQDVNNHKPIFTACETYHPVVMEDYPPRTFVVQVSADDKDMGVNGEVEYSIERPFGSLHHFEIDSKTGVITTLQSFDREEKSTYQIRIIGRDGGPNRNIAERLMGFCQVDIEIGDKNDFPPVFQNKRYEATIKEDFEVGRSVLHVSASDKDAGSNAMITYTLDDNKFFTIDNATGTITSKAKLTKSGRIPLYVHATDNGIPRRAAKVSVTIIVLALGNDPPMFTQGVYVAYVDENIATSSSIIQVKAVIKDAGNNNRIYYSIVPGNLPSTNNPKRFQIETITGIVRTSHLLDYETTSNFSLTIRAETTNPPRSTFANLKIFLEDVNDSPPEFTMSRYQGHVSENAPIGSSVVRVTAKDPDQGRNGHVTYSFVQDDNSRKFHLEENSGLITTTEVFDRETQGRYTLAVKARDNGEPQKMSDAIVEIIIKDENDNPPIFEQNVYNISIFENAATGSKVLKVSAIDKDFGVNARVSYYISEGNIAAVFAMNRDFGKITVASALDRETIDVYKLTITAKDGKNSGEATVNVRVKDVNDNNPKFKEPSYVAVVSENEPPGTSVMILSASDPDLGANGEFVFSISGQGLGAFSVNPQTGEIRTRVSLDREMKARYDFLAFAIDAPGMGSRRTGSTDVTVIVRDVNDNSPAFPDHPYIGQVQENLGAGASVMVMSAVDKDDPNEKGNAVITYELINDANGLFSIEMHSGLIRTRRMLDRESKDVYEVVVGATDKGDTPQEGEVTVTIKVDDANDQRPRFTRRLFEANVSEAAALGSTITTISATDDDTGINAKLLYSIVDGDGRRNFRIDEETGAILVEKSLDFETQKTYRLTVKVRDSGTPSYSDIAEVVINVLDYNDNPPVFKPVSYSDEVMEDVQPGFSLLRVYASDSDTGEHKLFKFSIAEGDPQGQFRINSDTGDLYTAKLLDRETNAVHILTVRATNIGTNKLYGHASVSIQVLDVNDNGPTFIPATYIVEVDENTAPPVELETLKVRDPDSDPQNGGPFTFGIRSGNENNLFELDPNSGRLRTRATFDREEKSEHLLVVWAQDSGKPPMKSHASVKVYIKDKNDHQHHRAHLDLTLNILDGKFPGGNVGQVYVKDDDTHDARYYELVDRDSKAFSVDRTSGMIVSILNPAEGQHSISVKVSDQKSNFHPVICTVKILVIKLPAEVIEKSIAIRLRKISMEDFLKSYMTSFKESVGEILGTLAKNVDLFSIQKAPNTLDSIDVRFAAHGSPYYSPERLVALIKAKRKNLGSTVLFVEEIGVDPCLHEPCEYSSCRSKLRVPGTIDVISFAGQSFVSIRADLVAVCEGCNAGRRLKDKCKRNTCRNGGICRVTPIGHICECPRGYNGKNCEMTTRSFKSGEWVWLPPLRQCRTSKLSMEFATKEVNGLLLYGGPASPVQVEFGDVYDHLVVELQGGKIYVTVCLGDRQDVLRIGVMAGKKLDDGKWHHVEINRNETFLRVTVDQCRDSVITEGSNRPRREDRSMCEAVGQMKKKKSKFLNLNGPLQLGGISNRDMPFPDLKYQDFTGCIRNVINEEEMYDLKTPARQKGSKEGCPVMDKHCIPSSCHVEATCIGSWTGHSCSCSMGRYGQTCTQATKPISYGNGSRTRYLFSNEFQYDPRETRIELRVRTRDQSGGILLHSVGTEKGEFSSLKIVPEKDPNTDSTRLVVVYSFNTGDRNAEIKANDVDVGDGEWCTIKVNRYRNMATLTVEKNGVNYIASGFTRGNHTLLVLDPIKTYVGGIPEDLEIPVTTRRKRRRRTITIDSDFTGCIDDVRFHGYQLHHNGTKVFGTAMSEGVSEGCDSNVCLISPCPTPLWCYDAWRKHVCYPRLCASSKPCLNGGTCVEGVDTAGANRFICQCTPAFQGRLCDIGRAVVSGRPDNGFENGLIIGLSVLLVSLILSICIVIMYIKRSKKDSYAVNMDEEDFKRDNVADYHIDGGVEEDIDHEVERFRDYVRSLDDIRGEFMQYPSKKKLLYSEDSSKAEKCSDTGYGGSSDESPTFILLTPIRNYRKSPTASGKSASDDEFFDCHDYHYSRAVAVNLNKRKGDKRSSDPSDLKTKKGETRRSDPTRLNITLNPFVEGLKPAKAKGDKSDMVKTRGEDTEGVASTISSDDEGFASPEASSPKSLKEISPEIFDPKIAVETAVKRRARSPGKKSKLSHYKNADAGSDPDRESYPPEKVPGPEFHEKKKEIPECPSPSVLLQNDDKQGRNFVPENQRNKKKPKKKIPPKNNTGDGSPDEGFPPEPDTVAKHPEDFPPSYEACASAEFPFPPKQLMASDFIPDDDGLDDILPPPPVNPTICLPSPVDFLPVDTAECFGYEGVGSPTISLSSLGSDPDDDVTWEAVKECGGKFRKLATIYGMPPSVSFNPNEEIIK